MTDDPTITSSLPLGPYRVLDLAEGGFNWCGKALGDMGADVIKIEPPDGSPTRDRGCLLYTSPSPRDRTRSRMPSSA